LLAATRRQLWLAVAALESKPRGLLGVAGMIWVPVVAWPARALSFLARSLWRSTRAVLRLVYMLRVLWP